MLLSIYILVKTLIAQVITKDGNLSADYALVIAISIIGFLIITIASFAFYTINKNLETMRDDFKESITTIINDVSKFREDFHTFVQIQSGFNAKIEERTKDKES